MRQLFPDTPSNKLSYCMNKKILHALIDANSDSVAKLPAIEWPGGKMTYQALKEYSNRIAHCLISEKATRGDVVGIYMRASGDYWAAALGVNKVGGAFMPLDPSYPQKRLQNLLDRVTPAIIITDDENLPGLLGCADGTVFSQRLSRIVV